MVKHSRKNTIIRYVVYVEVKIHIYIKEFLDGLDIKMITGIGISNHIYAVSWIEYEFK